MNPDEEVFPNNTMKHVELMRMVREIRAAYASSTIAAEEEVRAILAVANTMREREIFESPTWKREGTQAYLTEAREAGFTEYDASTGQAFRYVGPEPQAAPQPEQGPSNNGQRVLVRVNMPHVEELTDGEHGPEMELVYRWEGAEPLSVGDLVVCPRSPRDRDHGLRVGQVVEVDQWKVNSQWRHATRALLAAWREGQKNFLLPPGANPADVRNFADALYKAITPSHLHKNRVSFP